MRSGSFGFVLILLLYTSGIFSIGFTSAEEAVEMVPMVEEGKVEMRVMLNDSRRKLGSFQVCSLCTCCGGASKSYCLPSPCCYAINCNIPNRPFGFCSFTPKTCNCFGCHIWLFSSSSSFFPFNIFYSRISYSDIWLICIWECEVGEENICCLLWEVVVVFIGSCFFKGQLFPGKFFYGLK